MTRSEAAAGLRYTNVAIALHWLIAVAILYNLASGLLHDSLPRGFFALHVSSGITILALTVVRIVWRLTHPRPPYLPMALWERRLAHAVHGLLYVGMLALPLTGWAMVSASPPAGSPGAAYAESLRTPPPPAPAGGADAKSPGGPAGEGKGGGHPPRKHGPLKVWGLFELPLIKPINAIGRTPDGIPRQRELHERFEGLHLAGGWIMLVLLVLHVGGALKHQLVDRQRELARMGLGRAAKWDPAE
jgi:cytochrome b561